MTVVVVQRFVYVVMMVVLLDLPHHIMAGEWRCITYCRL